MSAHATSPSYPERQEILALPNRAVFADLIEAALERAGGEAMCMVLVLDVARFRQANERYARATGDDVLTAIAGVLKRLVGPGAAVGSLGADEFAVLVPGPHTHRYAVSLAKSIATVLGPPVSVGIAFAQPGSDAAALLGAADRASTGAQERGDPYGIFAATREAQVECSLQLEQELRGAIDGGQLCLYYQPIIDVKSGRSAGLTARVRWDHPVYGLLAPGHFLPLVEAGSLASDLGAEIVALACRDLAHWTVSLPLPGPPPVHVKVSTRQLSEPGFVEIILGELQRGGVDPSLLAVELAGSVVVDEGDVVPRALQRLAEAGITAVLDDFGTGNAPPSSLKDIPVRGLKLGSVFVNGLPDSEADVRMTEAMITIGRSLKLPVVAKCVETHAQLATVRGLGCERVQGFLFGRPAAADVTLALLRQATNWGETLHAGGSRTLP
ncbi:MAG: bifunctional diguanylate cyclase/phosphodiesterase, partial [Chloroflexota bacterium]|nr:bifunctional diguanylate cyclase/phosphodiesterase [Chloroflexota bacterium]